MAKGRLLQQLFTQYASYFFGDRRDRGDMKKATQQPNRKDDRNSTRREISANGEILRVDPNFLVVSSIIARVFGVQHAVVHLFRATWKPPRSQLCPDDDSVASSGTQDLPECFLLDLARELSGIVYVPECQDDARLRSSPLVSEPLNIRYFVGVPLFVDGVKVGILSLMDSEPREGSSLGHADRLLLADFGALVSESISRNNEAGMPCMEQSQIMVRMI
jgi:GAF domain-containing protein